MNGGKIAGMMHGSGAMRNREHGALWRAWIMDHSHDFSQELFITTII
jgi:hypothetical protein